MQHPTGKHIQFPCIPRVEIYNITDKANGKTKKQNGGLWECLKKSRVPRMSWCQVWVIWINKKLQNSSLLLQSCWFLCLFNAKKGWGTKFYPNSLMWKNWWCNFPTFSPEFKHDCLGFRIVKAASLVWLRFTIWRNRKDLKGICTIFFACLIPGMWLVSTFPLKLIKEQTK